MRYSEEVYKKVFPDVPAAETPAESAVVNFPKNDKPAAVPDQVQEDELMTEVDGGDTDGDTGNCKPTDE